MAEKSEERFALRNALIMLHRDLDVNPTKQRFSLRELREHNIHVQSMSLDKKSPHKPRFFAPYDNVPPLSSHDPDHIDELQDELSSRQGYIHPDGYSRELHRHWARYVRYQLQYTHERKQKQKWPWVRPGSEKALKVGLFEWLLCEGLPNAKNGEECSQPLELSIAVDRKLPHIKAAIMVNADGDNEEFFRGEIMSVLRLIIWQMRQRRLVEHIKIPALVLSIIADRARLIEAFCEDGKIVFRATELYDFPKDIEVAFPLFAQWFHGSPTGI